MSGHQERGEDKKDSDQTDLSHQVKGIDIQPMGDSKQASSAEIKKGSDLFSDKSSYSDDLNTAVRTRGESLSEASPHASAFAQEIKSDLEVKLPQNDPGQGNSELLIDFDDHNEKSTNVMENQPFAQHLFLTSGISGSSSEFGDQVSIGSDGASVKSHEIVPDFSNASRPESLSLKPSTSDKEVSESDFFPTDPETEDAAFDDSVRRKTEPMGTLSKQLTQNDGYSSLSKSLPQGTITRKGDLIEFVASDLQEKIKQSSPLSQPDAASSGSRRSSIKSYASVSSSTSFATSSGMSQSPSSVCQQSPDDIPPIDAAAVVELEHHAARVADSLDLMMGNIRNNLHKMSAITIGCQEAYKRSVDITCDSVDASIKTMYALMAKCEELSASMVPVQQLAFQIKEIKRVLDLFESQLADK